MAASASARRAAEKTPACRCTTSGCTCDFAAETNLEEMLAPLGYDVCLEDGDCEPCAASEASAVYCERTGRRQRVVCARCGKTGGPPLFCSYSALRPIWKANLSSPAWVSAVARSNNGSSRDGSQQGAGLFFRSCGSDTAPSSGASASVRHFRERVRSAAAASESDDVENADKTSDTGEPAATLKGFDYSDEAEDGDSDDGDVDRDYDTEDDSDQAEREAKWSDLANAAASMRSNASSAVRPRMTTPPPDETPQVMTFLFLNAVLLAAALHSLRRQQNNDLQTTMQGLYAKVGIDTGSAVAPASAPTRKHAGASSSGGGSQGAARRGSGAAGTEAPAKFGDSANAAVPDSIGRSIESIATAVNRTSKAVELAMMGEGTAGAEQKMK